jgi:SAM-dependent methyltransferase
MRKNIIYLLLMITGVIHACTAAQFSFLEAHSKLAQAMGELENAISALNTPAPAERLTFSLNDIKKLYPWVNKRWKAHDPFGQPYLKKIHDFILGHCNIPYNERALPECSTVGLNDVGLWIPYDQSIEKILNSISHMYEKSPPEGLKIADLGCGPGFLSLLISLIYDGEKPITIYCVDCVEPNLATFAKKREAFEGLLGLDFSGVTYKTMVKRIQDLPQTNSFGKKNQGTFHAVVYANVLRLMSILEKDNALKRAHDLLKDGGKLFFTHSQLNTYQPLGSDVTVGTYVTSYAYNPAVNKIACMENSATPCKDKDPRQMMSPQACIVPWRSGYKELSLSEFISRSSQLKKRDAPNNSAWAVLFYRVTEAVSATTLLEKCRAAGFNAENSAVYPYSFDDSSLIGGKMNSAPAFLVVATK